MSNIFSNSCKFLKYLQELTISDMKSNFLEALAITYYFCTAKTAALCLSV